MNQTKQEVITKGEITLGMNPSQAHLAGGAYAFRVIANPKHWKEDADPNEGLQTFQVEFQQGKVVKIQHLSKEPKC
ncbi:MAG: hypothetical protein PHR87_08800 [Sulfurospirillaceae bacterium]|nr:hypothetical protein [Sulfurospirillaceae bacterium]